MISAALGSGFKGQDARILRNGRSVPGRCKCHKNDSLLLLFQTTDAAILPEGVDLRGSAQTCRHMEHAPRALLGATQGEQAPMVARSPETGARCGCDIIGAHPPGIPSLNVPFAPFIDADRRAPTDRQMTKDLVAVLVPLSKASRFTDSEMISLTHIDRFLSRYPRYFLAPPGNTLRHPGFSQVQFSGKYFGSASAHSRLMLSKTLYSAFSRFEFVLIHHLDSLVFSDQLATWCHRGFDLIAPPWIPGPDLPWCQEPGVGNGGLSLRRVQSFLQILSSRRHWHEPGELQLPEAAGIRTHLKYYARRLGFNNGVNAEIRDHLRCGKNEDIFWWDSGRKYLPEFNIAPVEAALRFGFEANPRECFELNRGNIPFGCHAWERYDRDFWLPFLLPPAATPESAASHR